MRDVFKLVQQAGYALGNLDITIIAQAPKLATFLAAMSTNIANDLSSQADRVNVKATTTEGMGFAGRKEGIEVHAVVLLLANQ